MQDRERSSKGSVVLDINKPKLRLRLPRDVSRSYYGVNQKYLSLGLDDTPANRAVAEYKAQQIENDLKCGQFDESLNKYKIFNHLSAVRPKQPAEDAKPAIAIPELWEKYSETKKPTCSPGYWKNTFLVFQSHLEKCPYQSLEDAQGLFDWSTQNLTPDTAKRLMMQLSAACRWGVKSRLISSNPFDGLASEIKVKKAGTEDNEINPFTREERDRIIEAFSKNRYYSRYTPLIKFLFFTGCRPSEALALQWKHITPNAIVFEQAVVHGQGGKTVKKGLKTQEKRKFPVNAQLLELLTEIKPQDASDDDLVFPSPDGTHIDFHNFRNRAWVGVFKDLDIEYRKPYQTRHTFITLCLENNVSVPQIAKWVGNSPKVIMEHYAGVTAQVQVPEL